ncbi:hypothetical protein Syun_028273 [Stephania yunnanensis]|uniref:Protein kinase domain-containing protein n=1 Tax=Stephania yunnanensis TaxID=152371 RepID=A0AAP0EMA4_9MAGN
MLDCKLFSDADHEMGNGESLQFDLDMIKVATGNFFSANQLGEGGFGALYKVNKVYAVKCHFSCSVFTS